MQIPIDVKDLLKAAGDIDQARRMPVSVALFCDESAPGDLLAFAKECFAPSGDHPNTQVQLIDYSGLPASIPVGCDVCVVAAGLSGATGQLSSMLRHAGMPVVVLTTLPALVQEIATASGHPINDLDLIDPLEPVAASDAEIAVAPEEPLELDAARTALMRKRLGGWVVDTYKDKRLAFALAFAFVRKPLAQEFVNATSLQNLGIGAVVILPGADMPLMTANQAKMLLQIAAAYGQEMGMARAKELAGVVAGAFALRAAARQVAGAVPGLGWAVKGGIGYAGTQAMGRAGIVYFEQITGGQPAASAMEAARAEAQRAADAYAVGANPVEGVGNVVASYANRAKMAFDNSFGNVVPTVKAVAPAVKQAAPVVKDALTTAVPAVRNAVVAIADATGVDPKDVAKQLITGALKSRRR